MERIKKTILCMLFMFIMTLPIQVNAETLEEYLNNLTGPKQQYTTMLSPVYLKNNYTEEYINPQSGELKLTQTDYVLPGRNGLDLEIKRIYKTGISNVEEMKVKYVNGAWVDYVESNASTSSFYEDRYNLGIGMRFSFPSLEIKDNSDGTSHIFLHTEGGDTYRLRRPTLLEGQVTHLVEGQTILDTIIREDSSYSNGQPDGTSKYLMTNKEGKKTYFTKDGRVIAIIDRYGNTIKFEYQTLSYTLDGTKIEKRLIAKIIDTIGREVTIEYKEDASYTAQPITAKTYTKDTIHTASQNPNTTDSGDLGGRFQVIVHLPDNTTLVYDKSAVLLTPSKHIVRTRVQSVYDVDGKMKYHYWYEQPNLGFSYTNKDKHSVYNRYENLVQINHCKTNRLTRYIYNTYTKKLNTGSMQYRKIFEKKDLVKKDYDSSKTAFLEGFIANTKNKTSYAYQNEADGFGYSGYDDNSDTYLKNTYRYTTTLTDANSSTTLYTYDGLHQLIETVRQGQDHKEIVKKEHDDMKLIKKQEQLIYSVQGGVVQETNPVKKIENYRYDQYGNLTNYTDTLAERDEAGYPVNHEHTVTYSYAYDKFHVPTSKTWKQDLHTTHQITYEVDALGNIIKETKRIGGNTNPMVTNYAYDAYGNLIKEEIVSDNTYTTFYEYAKDMNQVDHKGAYLTKKYQIIEGQQQAKTYSYDPLTGAKIKEADENGHTTTYTYDSLGRLLEVIYPDNSSKTYQYKENPFLNFLIESIDQENIKRLNQYDIYGNLLSSSLYDKGTWHVIQTNEYDVFSNKIKTIDSNGHSTRFKYNSKHVLTQKSIYDNDQILKSTLSLDYTVGYSTAIPLFLLITDERGYKKNYYYDIKNRLIKQEVTPDHTAYYKTTYTYDYLGNQTCIIDPKGNETYFHYDALGRLTSKVDALGNETSYTYNSLNDLTKIEEPGSKITEKIYDQRGRLIEERQYNKGEQDYTYTESTYDAAGNLITINKGEAKNGHKSTLAHTQMVYDTMNRLTDIYRQIDETTQSHEINTYDKKGNKIKNRQYADKAETQYFDYTYAYDYANRIIHEEAQYFDGSSIQGKTIKKSFYDYEGNLLQTHQLNATPKSQEQYDITTYQYDYKNQLIEKREPIAAGKESIETYSYDLAGNLIKSSIVIQGTRVHTLLSYDGLSRMLSETDPLNHTTRYAYDECNNLIKEADPRDPLTAIHNALGIEYAYDALNRLVKTTVKDNNSRTVIAYKVYDKRGNVVKEVDGEGYHTDDPNQSIGAEYTYDIYDRMTGYRSPQTSADNKKNGTQYHTKEITYNGLGQVIEEKDAYGHTTTYTYNRIGQLKQVIYPDQSTESYTYDLTGMAYKEKKDRAGNKTVNYHNLFGQPYKIIHPDNTVNTYIYSSKGQVVESIDREGNRTMMTYDRAGNEIQRMVYLSENSHYRYYQLTNKTYDEIGHLLTEEIFSCEQPKKSGLPEKRTSSGYKVTYSYDKAGRLIQQSGPMTREIRYAYDEKDHLITKKTKTNPKQYTVNRYHYDVLSRLIKDSVLVDTSDIASNYLAGADYDKEDPTKVLSETAYTYNKNGQVITKTDANQQTSHYTYDYDKQLLQQSDPLGSQTSYKYDRRGNRVEQTNAKLDVTYYEYDSDNRLIRKKEPVDDESYAVTRYLYDVMGNLIKEIQPNQYHSTKDTEAQVNEMKGNSYTYDTMQRLITTLSPEGQILQVISYTKNGQVKKQVDGLNYTDHIEADLGNSYTYDGIGNIIKATNALGHSETYQYDVLGNLTAKTDAKNQTVIYTYNSDKTLSKTTYPDGGAIHYTYDDAGRLIEQVDQLGRKTQYSYTSLDQIREETDANLNKTIYYYDLKGNAVQVKDKLGSVTYLVYDKADRLLTKKIPLEKDDSGNKLYTIETYTYDPLGNILVYAVTGSKTIEERKTTYTYYPNHQVKTQQTSGGSTITYEYDKNSNPIKTQTLIASGKYDIERFIYDSSNRVIRKIKLYDTQMIENGSSYSDLIDQDHNEKLQQITEYEYDRLGHVTKETAPRAFTTQGSKEDYTTTYTYDPLGRIDKIIRNHNNEQAIVEYTYDEAGNKIKETDPRGSETHYTYDYAQRITTITQDTYQMTYTYDLAGNKIKETNAKGESITYAYDNLNQVITITNPYGEVITTHTYDAKGNIITTQDAKGSPTTYTYDEANRLRTITDPLNNTTKHNYNVFSEVITTIDPLGNTTSYSYNYQGNLTQVTDAQGTHTQYGYDKAGNKTYMMDGRGKITRYSYGSHNQLIEVKDPSYNTITYTYDLAGNLAQMKDKNNHHTIYIYDPNHQLIEKTVAETTDTITYAYDKAGNRTIMEDESGKTAYTYDALNRIKTITKDGQLEITYTYDAIGNIAVVTDKKGNTTSYSYDKANRLKTVTSHQATTTYTYDKNSNRSSITYEGGVQETYTYDKKNQLITITNQTPQGKKLSQYTYTYDAIGRQTSKTDSYGTTTYSYDKAGRITTVTAPGKTTVYTYDQAGNRQSMIETYTSNQPSTYTNISTQQPTYYITKKSQYFYSSSNQLLQLVEIMRNDKNEEVLEKTTQYRYDSNGNELTQTISYLHPHTTSMRQQTEGIIYGNGQSGEISTLIEKTNNTFDGFNRLKTIETIREGIRTTASYTYNGDGLRTKKEVKASTDNYAVKTTNYYYDRQHVILETDQADNTKVHYIRGSNYIARVDSADRIAYYVHNGHGDVVMTVNREGNIENQYDYDIFGNPTLTIEESYENSIRYSGEFFDTETGLYYLRARYYNSYTGRFISQDSYWGEDTNPLSLNLYTYCYNDPIMYIDPTGHYGGKHGEADDSLLSRKDQNKIKALTDEWFAADGDEEEQERIHQEAEKIRDEAKKNGTLSEDNRDSFSKEANEIIKRDGYFTEDTWTKTSKKHNRRSGGRGTGRSSRSSKKKKNRNRNQKNEEQDFQKYIDKILGEAETYSDYILGTDNYSESIKIVEKHKGTVEAIKQVIRDIDIQKPVASTFNPLNLKRVSYMGGIFDGSFEEPSEQLDVYNIIQSFLVGTVTSITDNLLHSSKDNLSTITSVLEVLETQICQGMGLDQRYSVLMDDLRNLIDDSFDLTSEELIELIEDRYVTDYENYYLGRTVADFTIAVAGAGLAVKGAVDIITGATGIVGSITGAIGTGGAGAAVAIPTIGASVGAISAGVAEAGIGWNVAHYAYNNGWKNNGKREIIINSKNGSNRNARSKLAGKEHPVSGVKFDDDGFPIFESKYDMYLKPEDYTKSRGTHFNRASKELYNSILKNSDLASKFTKNEINLFKNGKVPNRFTWHHHQKPGLMQLVDRTIHRQTGHTGGFSIWGAGNK